MPKHACRYQNYAPSSSEQMNIFCNLPGSWQPSHGFELGNTLIYDSARKPYTINNSKVYKMASQLPWLTGSSVNLSCVALVKDRLSLSAYLIPAHESYLRDWSLRVTYVRS